MPKLNGIKLLLRYNFFKAGFGEKHYQEYTLSYIFLKYTVKNLFGSLVNYLLENWIIIFDDYYYA